MADREKLINELANDIAFHCPDMVEYGCWVYNCASCLAERLADDGYHKAVQKWIPANKPPKDTTENLWVIYKVGGSYCYSTGYYDGQWWRSAITDNRIQIAGWMPLPEPPQGE